MAKKKVPSVDDAITIFKNAMLRASLSDYLYVNNNLISSNDKGNTIIVIPDQTLWLRIIDDVDMKDHLSELDINKKGDREKMKLLQYAGDFDNDAWVEIDNDVLFSGKLFNINVEGLEYEVPINKGLIPLKLRKAEYNNIKYRIFPDSILSLKKRFDFPAIENCGFSIVRMFQLI